MLPLIQAWWEWAFIHSFSGHLRCTHWLASLVLLPANGPQFTRVLVCCAVRCLFDTFSFHGFHWLPPRHQSRSLRGNRNDNLWASSKHIHGCVYQSNWYGIGPFWVNTPVWRESAYGGESHQSGLAVTGHGCVGGSHDLWETFKWHGETTSA